MLGMRKPTHDSYLGVIWALVWTSFEFSQAARGEERNPDSTRSFAAQLIAIRILRSMSSNDVVRALTLDFELPGTDESATGESISRVDDDSQGVGADRMDTESGITTSMSSNHSPGMSALEVAIVGDAMKFVASTVVQHILVDIWKGNVVL